MSTLQLHAHRQALVSRARCPGCAEILSGKSLYGGAPCKYCDTPTDLFGVSGKIAAQSFRRKAWIHLGLLTLLVGFSYLILGWIPLLGAVALIVAGLWIKMGILYPVTKTFSLQRRIITRWSAKMMLAMFIILSIIICEMMTLTGFLSGFLKAFIGGFQVAVAAFLVTSYVSWQIGREQRGTPIAWWEWSFVGSVSVALMATAAFAVVMLVALAYAFQWVLDVVTPYLI